MVVDVGGGTVDITVHEVVGKAFEEFLQEIVGKDVYDKFSRSRGFRIGSLKGAVLFGHDPITIVSRIAKYSYGKRVFRDFVEGTHPKEKREKFGDSIKSVKIGALNMMFGGVEVVVEPHEEKTGKKSKAKFDFL
ncbi:hypothetical protein DPMN_055965 [Dreissena polymorpha]|uniref:Uncharacterized protein n=1 Tax=Dreissena polymorpha TaxID=45954 RepID=A0A9D4HT24_DREPO|nr:hypothetical protein DPMN_055965 [Dreissena polymorpha]